MANTYKVLERSFINGRLCQPGDTVVLEIDSPGSNLELVPGEDHGGDEKDQIIAELKTYGIDADKRTGLDKLLAKLAEAKGE